MSTVLTAHDASAGGARPRRLIRLPEVMRRTSLSERGIYSLMTADQFPKPISLNPDPNVDQKRAGKAWDEAAVDRWIEERLAARAPASADA